MSFVKTTSILVIFSLLAVSCSKETSSPAVNSNGTVSNLQKEDPHALYSLWVRLATQDSSNLALSEFLATSVFNENQKYIEKNVKPLSLDEIQSLVSKLERNSKSTTTDLLFYGSNLKNDLDFVKKTVLSGEGSETNLTSFQQQFKLNTAAQIKRDLLVNILKTYDERIAENSNLLADYILNDISENNPALKESWEKTAQENPSALNDLITKTLPTLSKVDTLFKNSNLNTDEQLTSAAIGIIGSQIYNKLKDKKSFKEILKAYTVVKDVINKAKEIQALLGGINDYQKEIKGNWKDLGKAMNGLAEDTAELKQKADYDPKISGKNVQKFLYNSLFKDAGKTPTEGSNPSILSKQIAVNQNFTTVIDKAEKITNGFNTILLSTQKIAKLLNINLPEGVQKAIVTTQKANMILSTVGKTLQGLKSGGVMGALSALSSASVMELMGMGDPEAEFRGQILAQLGVINQKLDDVINLQKQTIQIQIETMSMIKDLAIMIDNQHRAEMDLLAEVRDISLTNLEINKIGLNSNLRACETILSMQLNSGHGLKVYTMDAYEDMRSLDLDIQKFKINLKNYSDIKKMINSTGENGWENCQSGLNQSFGLINVSENPIRGIFSSDESQNLFKFQREVYSPLNRFLKANKKSSTLFHLPVKDFSSLIQKYNYFKNDLYANINYIMDDFISTRALERNTAQLLVFYPFLDLTASEWQSGLENVLNLSIDNANNKNNRAYHLLRNNLTLIQTAIAQEALLSGELIFDQLRANVNSVFKNKINSSSELSYAVLTNRLLMKNFMKYLIFNNIDDNANTLSIQEYAQAYMNKDLKTLATYFESDVVRDNLGLDKDGNPELKLNIDGVEQTYLLPSEIELKDNKIIYSANMYRLMELQKRVLDALIKVAPNNLTAPQKEQFGRMLIYP